MAICVKVTRQNSIKTSNFGKFEFWGKRLNLIAPVQENPLVSALLTFLHLALLVSNRIFHPETLIIFCIAFPSSFLQNVHSHFCKRDRVAILKMRQYKIQITELKAKKMIKKFRNSTKLMGLKQGNLDFLGFKSTMKLSTKKVKIWQPLSTHVSLH